MIVKAEMTREGIPMYPIMVVPFWSRAFIPIVGDTEGTGSKAWTKVAAEPYSCDAKVR